MGSELGKKLVYSDLDFIPDDGRRFELVRGELFVTPSPTPMHQRASKRLQRQLEAYFEERGLGEVFNAPVDLILTESDVFVPDILVVTDAAAISRRGIEAPPVLVVEVLSPSTRSRDRGIKAQRYAELEIRHYWILDHEDRRLECHELSRGTYRKVRAAEGDAVLRHPAWDGLEIRLQALWS